MNPTPGDVLGFQGSLWINQTPPDFITEVAHDSSLVGNGTNLSPLGLAPVTVATVVPYPASVTYNDYGQVVSSIAGDAPVESLTAGAGISITGTAAAPIVAQTAVGTAGTYAYPTSITTDVSGNVTAITAGGATPTSGAYTPTFSAGSSIDMSSITGVDCNYRVVGDYVDACMNLDFQYGATGELQATFTHTMPVAPVNNWGSTGGPKGVVTLRRANGPSATTFGKGSIVTQVAASKNGSVRICALVATATDVWNCCAQFSYKWNN